MLGEWLSWKKFRLFVFDYWPSLLAAGVGCLALVSVVYFIHVQSSARQERLNQLNVQKKQAVRTRPVKDVADVDQPLEGLLPPDPKMRRSEEDTPQPIPSWGPPVQESSPRVPEIPLQSPEPRSGPNG